MTGKSRAVTFRPKLERLLTAIWKNYKASLPQGQIALSKYGSADSLDLLLASDEAAFLLDNEYLVTEDARKRSFFQDIRTALSAIRRCISPEKGKRSSSFFAVFSATDSKVSNFFTCWGS
jgi:hypothetical protein